MVMRWFREQGVKLNQDASALSELLQWIWRSSIRNGNQITLYVPSRRMRTLLRDFLETGAFEGHSKVNIENINEAA